MAETSNFKDNITAVDLVLHVNEVLSPSSYTRIGKYILFIH